MQAKIIQAVEFLDNLRDGSIYNVNVSWKKGSQDIKNELKMTEIMVSYGAGKRMRYRKCLFDHALIEEQTIVPVNLERAYWAVMVGDDVIIEEQTIVAVNLDRQARWQTDIWKLGKHPYELSKIGFWIYHAYVVEVTGVFHSDEEQSLLVREAVMKRENRLTKLARLAALEDKMKKASRRESIPDAVKMFVWQRDQGQCIRCGSKENLEFDHIIPIIKGGSNTERNLQLLCEQCNREKSDSIG